MQHADSLRFTPPLAAYRASARRITEAIFSLRHAIKYDASQPRAPAGNPDGGQWIHDDTSAQTHYELTSTRYDDDVERISSFAQMHSIASKPRGYQRCLDLCYPLLERFKDPIWTDKNTWDFHKCMNACMKSEGKGL